MAVKIRLRRVGAKKAPFYRVVVADSRFPRDGRFIEEIGTYDPNKEPSEVKIDAEKAKQWIANGAQPTDTVRGPAEEVQRSVSREGCTHAGAVAGSCPRSRGGQGRRQGYGGRAPRAGTIVYHLSVAEGDMGRVIGKQGRIAKAIRVVMRAAAVRVDEKVLVEID